MLPDGEPVVEKEIDGLVMETKLSVGVSDEIKVADCVGEGELDGMIIIME